MPRIRWSLLLILLAGSVACSGGGPPLPTDGGDSPTEPASYWGLADQTCWWFDDGSGNDLYTVAVDLDTTTIPNTTTYHLALRYSGLGQRDDYLQVSKNTLLLWYQVDQASSLSQPTEYLMFSPPPVLFDEGLDTGQQVTTMTTAMTSTSSTNVNEPMTYITTCAQTMATTVLGQTYSVTQYLVSVAAGADGGTQNTVDQYWFAPELGMVELQLNGMTTPWKLAKVSGNVASTDCIPPS